MDHLQGELIAPQSREWLSSAENPRIHSVYRKSVNLLEPRSGLMSVVLPDLGPGPFAIVAKPVENTFEGFQSLKVKSQVAVREGLLQIDDIQIDTAGAREWHPQPDWEGMRNLLDTARVSKLKATLMKYAPPNSFAPLVNGAEPASDQSFQAEALQAAVSPARSLSRGLTSGSHADIELAAARLAGLGGGVTPSGDDYLQGAIHALWSALPESRAKNLSRVILRAAAPRTNAISGAWLQAAARGEAGEDWHLLVRALDSDTELEQAAIRLVNRGHTSGADALAGFINVLSSFGQH